MMDALTETNVRMMHHLTEISMGRLMARRVVQRPKSLIRIPRLCTTQIVVSMTQIRDG